MKRIVSLVLIVLVVPALGACGGDDESTVTETVTTTPSVTTTDTTSTEPTTTTGGTGPGVSGGEVADLPLCSEGPPPCRASSGEVVEP